MIYAEIIKYTGESHEKDVNINQSRGIAMISYPGFEGQENLGQK